MTPADLAAALGVDESRVRIDPWRCLSCDVDGRFWIVEQPRAEPPRPTLRCVDDARGATIAIPITTTLKAAVAHVRAMLAVPEPTP